MLAAGLLIFVMAARMQTMDALSAQGMKRSSPSAERNREPIFRALVPHLPAEGRALEVASGTGQHAAYFLERLGGWTWQPTELSEDAHPSIMAYGADLPEGAGRMLPPLSLDVLRPDSLPEPLGVDLMLCCNMVHIAPSACTPALFDVAATHVKAGGLCAVYGPFRVGGRMVESNERFDASLKARDSEWGIRDLEWVEQEAAARGFALREEEGGSGIVEMPANNLLLLFRRA